MIHYTKGLDHQILWIQERQVSISMLCVCHLDNQLKTKRHMERCIYLESALSSSVHQMINHPLDNTKDHKV
jgi:hypothetical protein